MSNKAYYIILVFFGMVVIPVCTYAQNPGDEPTDDLGNVTDAFQENFFEALKQKGIENYELALNALDKAEKTAKNDPKSEAIIYFEMGKNQVALKRYEEAETNFNKVITLEGDRLEVLEALYDLYYLDRNYNKAIPLVQKLIPFDDDYKEDLANLYSRTKQYDKAIELLDELDESWGESDYRDTLRRHIYRVTGNTEGAIVKLETKIIKSPKKEKDYLNLIYLYSEQGATDKAFETAKELLKQNPKSELVHLALYKFYLDQGNTLDAMASMKKVFASSKIEKENKYKVLGDFIQFVHTNPQYEKELNATIKLFSEDNNGAVFEKVGDYFLDKGKKEEALGFYEKGIVTDPDNYSLLRNTLLLQIDFSKYEEAAKLSSDALEIFPAQPIIYLLNGVANNGLQQADLAIESLETGIDFLLDDPKMEKDFYEQLKNAYTLKGDSGKANFYSKKALEVRDSN